MARSRNIKPGFFRNEILGAADPLCALLFAGLWTLADREGRLEDRPLRIKADVFPYRDGVNVDQLLGWLAENKFIVRYRVHGKAYIHVLEFTKHQSPHKNENASEFPGPEQADKPDSENIARNTEKLGTARADSLIPDSLITDSRFSDSGLSDTRLPIKPCDPAKRRIAEKGSGEVQKEGKTNPAWQEYSAAYLARYGTEPVRNAKVNGQLAQLVQRLGEQEAPKVASFYVSHSAAIYVRGKHPVSLLVRDCEGLRTEWATGRKVTESAARKADQTAGRGEIFKKLIAEAQALPAAATTDERNGHAGK